jgi:hypothetical protein
MISGLVLEHRARLGGEETSLTINKQIYDRDTELARTFALCSHNHVGGPVTRSRPSDGIMLGEANHHEN